ncbi:MAG: hypothetical protein HYY30_07750 [Chloroflexi bacterium]|nr:hypothetical protein [Chloroflexota bacterium]
MRCLIRLSVILLLVVAIVPATVFAANDTTDTAILLTAENPSHADRLFGDTGGAVRFYRIDYAGNGRPVKIDLTAIPGRDTSGPAFGFKLYGPNGLVGEASIENNESDRTRYSMTLSGATAGPYLIQVYNYTDGIAIDFDIQANGLAEATAQPPSGEPIGSTPDEPVQITQSSVSIGGSIVGESDGKAQYFSVDYPGGSSSMTMDLKYSPPSTFENGAVGFNLYDLSKTGDQSLVARGAETQRDGAQATVSYTLVENAFGSYLLQVFNYQSGLTVNYVLNVSGAAGQILQATDNTVPEKALVLSASAAGARGSIGPGSDATFSYFLVRHPGGDRGINVRLTVDQAEGIVDNQVGFNLYEGADLAGQGMAALNDSGDKRIANITVFESSEVTFGIQVFNYSTTAPARFFLYVAGL